MPESARSTELCCGGLEGLPAGYAVAAAGPVVNRSITSEGVGGVVNELLVQMQSFDEVTGMQKFQAKFVDWINLYLAPNRQLKRPVPPSTNVLVIAATNRADALDPALLRPGRFDRRLTFELPSKAARRELIDHFLARKSHEAELELDEQRDTLAAATQGYSPVMIEHLLDEALINAMRRGAPAMNRQDIERARMVEQVGMGQPVAYTVHEKRLIATHEAGHATAAYLVAPARRMEILTIIKRRGALGMLAHGDVDDVYTRSRTEMLGLIQIALGGQCAEEIFFGDVSTGPGGDLLYATNVAAEMVGSVGMMGTLVSYAAVQNSAFSDTNMVGRVLADPNGRGRVEELLQDQKVRVKGLLEENAHLVEALARRVDGAARADRPRDHRCAGGRPRGGPAASSARPAGHRPGALALQRRPLGADDRHVESVAAPDPAVLADARPAVWVGSGVVLRLGSARYVVPMAHVAEVVHVPRTTRVPASPGWLVGLANWRGRVLPVLDLRPLLGAETVPLATSARLVVLTLDDVEAGLLADQVPGPLPQAEWTVAPPPPTAASAVADLLAGVLQDDGGPVSLLDAAAVLSLGAEAAGR